MSGTVNVTLTAAGRVNTPPATLNATLIANAVSLSPGLTATLPGSLIEDISSTDTGALIVIDQAVTETLASISPYTANPYILTQLGQIYLGQGSTATPATNTSVYCVFTGSGVDGFVVAPGFTVSDGSNQYVTTIGGIVESGGSTGLIQFYAISSASFAVPANSVTTIVTSLPVGIGLTVTNPSSGTPGGAAQTEGAYRAQVLTAGLVGATGMPNYLTTLLLAIPGVQSNLINIRQQPGPTWEIIVGGTGDQYAIGLAIFEALFDINTLTGSSLLVTGITNANPGVVTTDLNHGYATGQTAQINGAVGITGINGTNFTATVISPTSFSIGIDTTSSGAWTSGGIVTPNFRNATVTINQYPNSYTIPYVLPPVQVVSLEVTWNTSDLNFVSQSGVALLVQPAMAAYINGLPVGAPINELEMDSVFQTAVISLIPTNLLTRLVYTVTIDGVVTAPGTGEATIFGDPESYFSIAAASIIVQQG
jgi:hypothetical protein